MRTAKEKAIDVLIVCVFFLVMLAVSADAQQVRACAPRDGVVERLATKYGETRQSIGLGGRNSVMEIFANRETGTWTALVTNPNGIACVVGAGQAFEALSEPLPPKGSDT